MAEFKRSGDEAAYSFKDARCIGRPCWAPGMYQHRAPLTCGGSRNTGSPEILASRGVVPQRLLGERFGVSKTAIRHIQLGRNWKHLREFPEVR